MGIELNNDQIYAIYDLEHWWNRNDRQLFQITGGAGTGKAQPDDTIIPTPNGKKILKELNVGDYVFDKDGKPTKILGIYPQGKKHVYEVTFEDGRKTKCSNEHLWTYINYKDEYKTTELSYIMGLNHCEIPMCKCVEYSHKEYEIDPYVIGAFIGNKFNKYLHLTLSTTESQIVDKILKLINSKEYKKVDENGYSYIFRLSDDDYNSYVADGIHKTCKNHLSRMFFKNLPEMMVDEDKKRIPEIYKYGDVEQRWQLIQGLFDLNGFVFLNYDKYNIGYTSSSKELIQDIKDLLNSLGIKSEIKTFSSESKINYNKNDHYHIYIKYNEELKDKFFSLQRKRYIAEQGLHTLKNVKFDRVTISKIEDLGYETNMRCIYVDNNDHLYLTNDYIVTHNTTLVRYFIDRLGLSTDNVLFVAFMGKAASVLQRNGLPAKTIHSAIYDYKERMARDESGKIIIKSNGKPKLEHYFELKDHISKKIKLIVVDEASMVDQNIGEDLLSFDIPVITLGDLNQLPPVFGKPFFLQNPDVTLHQIMRQAEGNPIIWLAQQVLAGNQLKYGVYGNSAIIRKSDITDFHFRQSDIIITGTNRLRYNINNYCREEIKGIKRLEYPHIGEKIICRKNNWGQCIGDSIYLTNGTTGFVDDIYRDSYNGKTMKMDFRPDFTKKVFKNIEFDYNHMYSILGSSDNKETPFSYLYDKMEYAYAITCHSCLSLDTLIYTEDGIQPIGDLVNYRGKVYNGTNFEKPSTYIDNGYDVINHIMLDNGLEYNVTNNHKCKVITKNGVETKYGSDLHPGDALLLRKNQELYKEDKKYKFKEFKHHHLNDECKIPYEMSIELAELIGMICCGGILYKSRIRYTSQYTINCHKFIELIKNIFGFECDMKISKDIKFYVDIDNIFIRDFFHHMKGLNINNKYIPKCILCSSSDYHIAFLRGLIYEYQIDKLRTGRFDGKLTFNVNSGKMRNQIAMILLNIGINCKYAEYKNEFSVNVDNSHKDVYEEFKKIFDIYWRGHMSDSIENAINNELIDLNSWEKILSPYIIEHCTLPYNIYELLDMIIHKYAIVHVISIEKRFGKTACLEMPISHVFLQNGILGGNSQGSQWPKVLYMHEDFMNDPEDRKKLLYTAITRASESLNIVI